MTGEAARWLWSEACYDGEDNKVGGVMLVLDVPTHLRRFGGAEDTKDIHAVASFLRSWADDIERIET